MWEVMLRASKLHCYLLQSVGHCMPRGGNPYRTSTIYTPFGKAYSGRILRRIDGHIPEGVFETRRRKKLPNIRLRLRVENTRLRIEVVLKAYA